jgi:prepilin-type N-terminal cleavage/methylation domain-containing protein
MQSSRSVRPPAGGGSTAGVIQTRSGDRVVIRWSPRRSAAPLGRAARRPSESRAGSARVHRDESGFTLVELLVVVLVLAALIAIAVPTFTGQREGAWDAAVRSELRSATIALESYRAQNGVYSELALAPGSTWGFERSGNLVYQDGFTLITPSTYCLIAQHVSSRTPNPNTSWMAREGERIRTIMPLDTCTDVARE